MPGKRKRITVAEVVAAYDELNVKPVRRMWMKTDDDFVVTGCCPGTAICMARGYIISLGVDVPFVDRVSFMLEKRLGAYYAGGFVAGVDGVTLEPPPDALWTEGWNDGAAVAAALGLDGD